MTETINFKQDGVNYLGKYMDNNIHTGAPIYCVQRYSGKTGKLLSRWRWAIQRADGSFKFFGNWESAGSGVVK